ncbi:MAG TPA: protoporphyrinogen oxidase HemJ [Azospirillaceae bacterium]|nr:protoporphyrinogen oxidase HemJ [Azospirillaceae bacterium]
MYLWVKALHVISVISWMAGLLYLPRLFVYHADAAPGSAQAETFKVMEAKLLRVIMNPAMIATWVFGLSMVAIDPALLSDGWLHAKFVLVLGLTAAHMVAARWRREFAEDRNTRPSRFYRMVNEVPALFMIGIVVLVVVKPF